MLASDGARVVLIDVTDQRTLEQGRALIRAFPDVRAIALALPELIADVVACADAGFVSYVPRTASAAEMCDIVRMALREEVACHPRVSGGLLRELRRRRTLAAGDEGLTDRLTQRECEVLRLLGRRLSNKEIARELCLSTATVKNHVHNILAKLNVHDRADALAKLQCDPLILSGSSRIA